MSDAVLTVIDQAWAATRDAHAAGLSDQEAERRQDRAAGAFIEALLSETLYCPVWEHDAEGGLQPITIEIAGRDAVLLFDTLERMTRYLREDADFEAWAGGDYFSLIAGDDEVQIALNPEVAPSATLFSPDTIEAIAELADAAEEEGEMLVDAPLSILPPDEASADLRLALSARIASARDVVAEAWLFTAAHPIEECVDDDEEAFDVAAEDLDEARQLFVGLTAETPRRPAELQTLAADLDRIGAASSGGRPLGVALFEPEEGILRLARGVGVDLRRARRGAA